ncbi:N-acetylmuramidase domain-containing protein [Ochrobactrum sp. GPK 3]
MVLSDEQIKSLAAIASDENIELAALIAVVAVESAGQIFAPGTRLPVIRWEGHYFYRLLKGNPRAMAVNLKLAAPKAGAIKNPKSQSARYDILHRAAEIDEVAAYSSISMGVGQVMGDHFKSLKFASPKAMFDSASTGLDGQVRLMTAFIKLNSLDDDIRRRDWSGFARGYNGPNYAKGGYHTKLAAEYKKAMSDPRVAGINDSSSVTPSAKSMLRLGSKGARVREVQQLLVRTGASIKVDGDFGLATRAAVKKFQTIVRIEADGVVGPKTFEALSKFMSAPTEKLGLVSIKDLPETFQGGVSGVSGVGMMAAADKVNEIAEKISGSGGVLDYVANGLYAVGGVVIVGSIAWSLYGYVKSHRTYEGLA